MRLSQAAIYDRGYTPSREDEDFARRWADDNPGQANRILAAMFGQNQDAAAQFASGNMPSLNIGMDTTVPAWQVINEVLASGDIAAGNFTTLVGTVNGVPFEPSYIGDRGLFNYDSITTKLLEVEFNPQLMMIVPISQPRAPLTQVDVERRTVMPLSTVKIGLKITLYPDEIAGVRGTGTGTMDTMDHRAAQKIINAVRWLRATMEFYRALTATGVTLDQDGSVINNFFNLLNIEQTTFNVTFGTASSAKWITIGGDILNMLEDALGGLDDALPPPISLEGRNYHAEFVAQADVQDAYRYFAVQRSVARMMNPLRDDLRYDDFDHGGIIHRQYRGSANNAPGTSSGRFIGDNEAQLIVDGVPGTYEARFGPPQDIIGRANQPGAPIDVTMEVLPHQKGWEIEMQVNPVHWLARPGVAINFYSSN